MKGTMAAVGQGILFVFLAAAAWQDFRKKAVQRWVYGLFGAAAMVWNLAELWMVLKAAGVDGEAVFPGGYHDVFAWLTGRVSGCLPGLGLLAAGRMSRGCIGVGDGWFFLVSGLLLSPAQNWGLLCSGVMLCGLYALGLLVYGQVRGELGFGKRTIPFLPFVALAEAGALLSQWIT